MKIQLIAITLLALGLPSSAHAFAPSIFYGVGFLRALQACPDLKIKKGDQLSIGAEYTAFVLDEVDNSANGFTPLLQFSMPDDASYFFRGDVGLQSADELQTNNWDGSPGYNIKYSNTTGNVTIRHTDGNGNLDTTCVLTPVPFGS